MKALSRLVLLLLLVIAPATATFGRASATGRDDGQRESCQRINARGVGQQDSVATTWARILGGGLLQGTTVGDFSSATTSDGIHFENGTITFTTNRGTLTVTVAFTMEFPSALQMIFIAEGPVTAATGKLAGATGSLKFVAVEDLGTRSFTERVTGRICIPQEHKGHGEGRDD